MDFNEAQMNGANDNTVSESFYYSCEFLLVGRFHYVPQFSHKGFTYYRAQSTAKDFALLSISNQKRIAFGISK